MTAEGWGANGEVFRKARMMRDHYAEGHQAGYADAGAEDVPLFERDDVEAWRLVNVDSARWVEGYCDGWQRWQDETNVGALPTSMGVMEVAA